MNTPQTPYPALAAAIGVPTLYLKREDLHRYGSHKGRSIPKMIYNYVRDGYTSFVISSSGNAALAAMMTVAEYNATNPATPLSLTVYIGHTIPDTKQAKLEALISAQVRIEQVDRPKQSAFLDAKDESIINLRQSTDDAALFGYHELAFELAEIPELAAIFIPTSSGTTAEGIAEGLEETDTTPQIHIAQTSSCHPIAEAVSSSPMRGDTQTIPPTRGDKGGSSVLQSVVQEQSLATAIVDNVAHRKDRIVEILKETHGQGWIITNKEVEQTIALVKEHCDITISPNSALSIAALVQAVRSGWMCEGAVVCLVCGE